MQINFRSFPHPVLSYFSDDYVNCLFQANVISTVTKTKYRFSVHSKTSSGDLLRFIEEGKALHALHIECPATRFRKLFTSDLDKFDVQVEAEELDGIVYLMPLIVASGDIKGYFSPDFHNDFSGTKFDVRKGDFLAIDRDREFIAQKEVDPLRRVPSIFAVMPNKMDEPPLLDLDADSHKVVVKLDPQTYATYSALSKNPQMAQILSSLVIVPALVELVTLISTAGEEGRADFGTLRWYQVLSVRLKELGYDTNDQLPDSSILIAQRLIGQPLGDALSLLSESEDEGDDE